MKREITNFGENTTRHKKPRIREYETMAITTLDAGRIKLIYEDLARPP